MTPDPDAQRLVDLLNPIAAGLRMAHGPDDGALFLLARFIRQIYAGEVKGRGGRGKGGKRTVKATLKNGGAKVRIPVDMIEESR